MTSSERHPLDDEPEEGSEHPKDSGEIPGLGTESSSPTTAVQPLLRISVVVVIASAIVAVLAGVSSTNAAPNSAVEVIGSAVNRIAVLVMLFAFAGILLAYRIPYMRQALAKRTPRTRTPRPFVNLLVLNLTWLGFFWLLLIALQTMFTGAPAIILLSLIFLYGALLTALIAVHDGMVRIYAVGSLTAMVLACTSGAMSWWSLARGIPATWPIGLLLSLFCVAGLLCAGYASIVEKFRASADEQ